MKIGYIGAGLMASPMIENLIEDGHEVAVWNRSPEKASALERVGARNCPTAASVCETGGVLFSCLADDAALEAVFGDGSVLAALGSGDVHASMSTISASCAATLDASHNAVGASYLGVPVLGRPDAVAGRLASFIMAGDAAAKARIQDVVQALGQKIFDFGNVPGNANVAKINFNFLISSAVEAMAEAFSVVEKSGLDPHAFYEMMAQSAFACPLYKNYGRQVVNQNWQTAGFRLELGLKDIRLALANAAEYNAEMRLAKLMENRFEQAIAHGLGELDWTAIAVDIRAEAGLDQ